MQSQTESPFTSIVGLGALKSEHRYKSAGKWFGVVFGMVCLLAAPFLCLLSAYLGYDTYTRFGSSRGLERVMDIDSGVGVTLCFGIGALVVGAFVLWEAWRSWPVAAALYENGLAYNDRGGLKQVRWDDVDGVWQSVTKHYRNGIYVGTTHLYTVQARDGMKIKLDDKLTDVEELGNQIQRGTASVLFPRYWQSLQNGQRVTFGPLALDLKGLYSGKKELTWQEIKGVKIAQGVISVKKDKGWFNWATVTVPQIPNFWIFYELIGRFAKVE